MTKSQTSSLKNDANGKLDEVLVAVCECGVTKEVTFRNLKNKWAKCHKCNQPMKVKSNAVSFISTPD